MGERLIPIHLVWSPARVLHWSLVIYNLHQWSTFGCRHCKIQFYADDALLHVSRSSITDIKSMLSEDLNHIIEWLNNNFLYLNYSKTNLMLTGTHQRLALVDIFTVRAGDTVLSRVYQFKYLGVMLDPHLSRNDHIQYIGRKISAKLVMLRQSAQGHFAWVVFNAL